MSGLTAGATLSGDGVYRYDLRRYLDPPLGSTDRAALFVMLNPSTADAMLDDHTVRCCRRLALREGCTRLHVVNLYAYRTPSPAVLVRAWRDGTDIIGPATDERLRRILVTITPSVRWEPEPLAIVAWGARPAGLDRGFHEARIDAVLATLALPAWCLGTTADGSPRHPSRLPTYVALAPWAPA